MKTMFGYLAIMIAISGCGLTGQQSFENHIISMNESIEDEHVKYKDGVLLIDNERIDIPEGDSLNISYKRNSQITRYIVRVDGELIVEAEIPAET
jgi:hypothetical protein